MPIDIDAKLGPDWIRRRCGDLGGRTLLLERVREHGDWGVVDADWGLSFFTPEWLLANITPTWSVRTLPNRTCPGQPGRLLLNVMRRGRALDRCAPLRTASPARPESVGSYLARSSPRWAPGPASIVSPASR